MTLKMTLLTPKMIRLHVLTGSEDVLPQTLEDFFDGHRDTRRL